LRSFEQGSVLVQCGLWQAVAVLLPFLTWLGVAVAVAVAVKPVVVESLAWELL
jgi:hypothetical protein